jgi:hypothetical protein
VYKPLLASQEGLYSVELVVMKYNYDQGRIKRAKNDKGRINRKE